MALGSRRLGGNRSLMVRARWGMMTRGETEKVLMVRASEPQYTVHLKISGRQFRGAVWGSGPLNRASLEATIS